MVYNPYIVVPLATWAVAQVLKFALAAMKGNIDFRNLYASGGMPSVHSAIVTSLAVTSLLVDGPGSSIFGLTLIFALVVMYDSFGVRRSAGELAVAMNVLLDNLDRNKFKIDGPKPKVRVILGHQPREVSVGALLGFGLAMLFNYDRLGTFGDFFQTVPGRTETYIFAAIFALLIIAGFVVRFILGRRYPKSKVMKRFRGRLFVAAETIGWLGLISSVLVYEHASYLAWRLWPGLILLLGVFWAVWIFTGPAKEVPAGLAAEATADRKQRWFKFGRKSR